MKQCAIYQVDAFTSELFKGNPAAVVPLAQWLDDYQLLEIAKENNLSETAYLLQEADDHYQIRWFSPLCEIDFCGHATLASALVLFRQSPQLQKVRFSTRQVGDLWVSRGADDWLEMDFPTRPPELVAQIPDELLAGLSKAPQQVLRSPQAWFVVYANADDVLGLRPDLELLKQLWPYDVVVTAPAQGVAEGQYDFISRYFWPANGGAEDPVTGSIHAGLAPYWGERLGKTALLAYQASARGGELRLNLQGDRVLVAGQAQLYLQGHILVP